MKLLVSILVVLFSVGSMAKTLKYKADLTQTPDMTAEGLDICGYPYDFKVNAKMPLAPTLITYMYDYGKVTASRIQSVTGSRNGSTDPAYDGPYRNKVYLVKQVLPHGGYAPGIYTRVQVVTYGSTSAPSGFTLSTELLNHRYSAELGPGAFCGDVYYKLQN